MSIEVLYFAELKDITKKQSESFQLPNSNMKGLIEFLFKKYAPLKNILWDTTSEKLRNNVSLAINDVLISSEDKLSITFSNGDKIAFLLPISGG